MKAGDRVRILRDYHYSVERDLDGRHHAMVVRAGTPGVVVGAGGPGAVWVKLPPPHTDMVFRLDMLEGVAP